MRKIKWLCVLGLFALLSENSFAQRGDFRQLYQGQSIDDLIINYMQMHNIPGLSMAIVQAPYIPRVVGYGIADTKSQRLVATNTMFNIGPVTSAFTAVAIMQLVDEGKLKLDDPIKLYLTSIPASWQAITVRQLFTHASGIPSFTKEAQFNYQNNYTHDQIISLVKDKPLLFQPGTAVFNSSTDFYLLGMIVEKTSGMSYEDYVTKNQIDRLQLKHTFFISTLHKVQNEINNKSVPFKHSEFKHNPIFINPTEPATGYTQINGTISEVKPNSESATYADSGIVSSAQDISIWDIALAGDILIKDQKNRDFLYHSITLNNGKVIPANAGWQFPGHPGLMYIEGSVPGFSSFLSRFTGPNDLLCVTLLANKDNLVDLEILARKISGAYGAHFAPPSGAPWIISRESPYSVEETINRFAKAIEQAGAKVFARIDHSANATQAGQQLNPMQVLIIGNPRVGTDLLQNSTIGLDLPLRVMAWREKSGIVWLTFTNPVELAKQYGIQGQQALLLKMYQGLNTAATKATTAY